MTKRRTAVPDIIPCPGWTPAATIRIPAPDPRPCRSGGQNQSLLLPGQAMCTRCRSRKAKWDRESRTVEDDRLAREARRTLLMRRTVERLRAVVPDLDPSAVISAMEALRIPRYDPERDPVEQERLAEADEHGYGWAPLDSFQRWQVLRVLFGLEVIP